MAMSFQAGGEAVCLWKTLHLLAIQMKMRFLIFFLSPVDQQCAASFCF